MDRSFGQSLNEEEWADTVILSLFYIPPPPAQRPNGDDHWNKAPRTILIGRYFFGHELFLHICICNLIILMNRVCLDCNANTFILFFVSLDDGIFFIITDFHH